MKTYRGHCKFCERWATFEVKDDSELVARDYEIHHAISPSCDFRAFTECEEYKPVPVVVIGVRRPTAEELDAPWTPEEEDAILEIDDITTEDPDPSGKKFDVN